MDVAADAIEPKWLKETPRESEAEFRLLFEKSPDAMLLLDGDVFIDCNQAAVEMMHCASKQQLLALHLYDISPERQPDGRLSTEKAHALIATAFREGSVQFEWLHRRVDGEDFPVEVLLTAIHLHGKRILHVSWRDISERKRAGEELREREAQYRGIFKSTSDAVLIFDFDGTIVEANPAACRMYGYTYEELVGLSGKDIVHPDYYYLFEDYKRQVKASGRFSAQSVDLRKDGSAINVEVHGAFFSYKGQPHLLAVVRDVTERVRARHMLEQRVAERTRELSTLLEVSRNIASTLELEPLLGLVLDQLKAVVDYSGATILTLEGDDLIVLAHRGPIPQDEALQLRFPLERVPVNREVIGRREPIIILDVRDNTSLARAFRETASGRLETTFSYIRSWMGIPLMVKDQVVGMLTLDHDEPNYYSPRQAELALAFANQVAVAVENARLYQAVQERQRELQTLLDVAAAASSSLDLDEMLTTTLDRLVALVGASRAGVMLLNGESGELEPKMLRPDYPIALDDLAEMTRACHTVIAGGEPLYVPPDPEEGFAEPGALLPLRARGQALGVLVIIGPQGSVFSEGHLALFGSIADQLGVAVENARLYEQAEQTAVAAERSRLARDLHDAVTQTLFSASLIAEVLPRIWERDPEEGRRRLGELRELSRGALAEMRMLLLELRPSALIDAALGDLLRQLAESITGRARVPVSVEVEGECALPPEVKVALYRIAQEALNNVAKHAGASRAAVSLRCTPPLPPLGGGEVRLCVSDDGRGFDPEGIPPESLGLGIMRERAEAIGATLAIGSEVGRGTEVTVVWRKGSKE